MLVCQHIQILFETEEPFRFIGFWQQWIITYVTSNDKSLALSQGPVSVGSPNPLPLKDRDISSLQNAVGPLAWDGQC